VSRQGALIAVLLGLAWAGRAGAKEPAPRWVFTGDILLSREVQREISRRGGASPWLNMKGVFDGADWVMGNLEGSVGDPASCRGTEESPCFAVPPESLRFPKAAGFTALGLENNHAADLGSDGRLRTRESVVQAGLSAIDFDRSPGFFRSKGHVLSLIAVSNVAGKDGRRTEIPSNGLRQKIRLARSLSDWVVISVHWGTELVSWPQPRQREMARWMIEQGADLIVGHHPHVVQAPECIQGKPVFFSLGNHVFDQKYPETKQGLIAECTVEADQLTCSGVETVIAPSTAFPEVRRPERKERQEIGACRVPKARPLVVSGHAVRPRLAEGQLAGGEIVLEGRKEGTRSWAVVARRLLSISGARLGGQDFLFSLEAHPSSIDQETGPRPYVYSVTPEGLVARWRGSALAWPLIDGELIRAPSGQEEQDYLCALHRGDSFIALDPGTSQTRTAVYRWNGFGFSGVEDAGLNARCRLAFQ